MDMRLVAGAMTGAALAGIVVLWALWRWQDARDERFVRDFWDKRT